MGEKYSYPNTSLRNIGKENFLSKKDPLQNLDSEDELLWEEDTLDSIPFDSVPIPVVDADSDSSPREVYKSGRPLNEKPGQLPIYFVKFYGNGKKSQSQLVKVTRTFSGGDPIAFIFRELQLGPNSEEKENGVLNALPKRLKFQPNYRIDGGILHLSLSRDIELGASPEIIKDRLDQITYSIVGNYGIKGIKLYVEEKRIRSLGGEGLPLPEILAKEPRKTLIF